MFNYYLSIIYFIIYYCLLLFRESPVVSLTDLQKPTASTSDANVDPVTTPTTVRSRNPLVKKNMRNF